MARNGFRNIASQAKPRKGRLAVIASGVCMLAACITVRYYWGSLSARAQTPELPRTAAAIPAGQAPTQIGSSNASASPSSVQGKKAIPDIVAAVNGQIVSREELAVECRIHYGKEVLEAMVNKYLILQECHRQNITISRHDVDDEIEQMAKSFGLPVEQWLKLLKQERGVTAEQYANDIIWPTLALRKLAGSRLQVTQEELMTAFEAEYGSSVKARMIICTTQDKAQKIQAMAAAHPDDFGNLAKTYSEDAPSASVKGLIQPIHKHGACPEIEQAAFAMSDGAVSNVIPSAGQFVILKRESLIEARRITLADAAPKLEKIIRDRKMRSVATDIFKQLQDHSVVKNVYNDKVLSQQMPAGVVALINDMQITLRQLDEECIARHGQEVLDGAINRKLIELACKRQNVVVTEPEVDAEIARAASLMVKPLANGSPDVRTWLELVSKKQGVSVEVYRRDSVWPSIALRKLAGGGKVEVTEEDMKKGFEANYGPRVKCLAIVLANMRRAQEVWELARKTPTAEYFGDLAAKYSVEASSRALRGDVPPIRKYGGQPDLESEAFALKPGELSGVIQMDDKFIVLFCEGHTEPINVQLDKVRGLLHEDLREKKERMAMAEYFEHLQKVATIDNFLDPGSSHSPDRGATVDTGATQTSYQAPVEK